MPERWKQYRDMPYSVGDWGNVRNDKSGRILHPSINKENVMYVRLLLNGEGYTRSLAMMVAEVWHKNDHPAFTTVMHLDGNRLNCFADNLTWRPRAYAMDYHRQFNRNGLFLGVHDTRLEGITSTPFIEVTTNHLEAFENIAVAGRIFGVLDKDIVRNLRENSLHHFNRHDPQPANPLPYTFVYI